MASLQLCDCCWLVSSSDLRTMQTESERSRRTTANMRVVPHDTGARRCLRCPECCSALPSVPKYIHVSADTGNAEYTRYWGIDSTVYICLMSSPTTTSSTYCFLSAVLGLSLSLSPLWTSPGVTSALKDSLAIEHLNLTLLTMTGSVLPLRRRMGNTDEEHRSTKNALTKRPCSLLTTSHTTKSSCPPAAFLGAE